MEAQDMVVTLFLFVSAACCLVFIYGLSTRTVWWKKFCGVGWFLMSIPVGGLLLTIYMATQEFEWGTFSNPYIGRICIAIYVILVVVGFTAILYKKNNVVEVEVVREEIVKEGS
jgi:peptidoglycan biosynthesis protein MviN/MurJ (putative lipid II flippase)